MSYEFQPGEPLSLNFIATRAARGTLEIETLRSGPDLVAWVRRSGIVHDLAMVQPDELNRARDLREALHRAVCWSIDGQALSTADRTVLNQTAAAPGPRLSLQPPAIQRAGGLPAVLGHLVHDLLGILDSPVRTSLRWCAGAECGRPMVDRSRDGRRRWCGKACRDRVHAAGYRERLRGSRVAAQLAAERLSYRL